MSVSPWDPEQYDRFRHERSQPFFDLLALVAPGPEMRVTDLGCGTGALTRIMHLQLHARETVGIDSSETMLARASENVAPGLRFERADLSAFVSHEDHDLVFSNAALHWVEDHEALIGRLTRALKVGGQLAVQVPANFDHPSHTIAAEVAREPPFNTALGGYTHKHAVLAPEEYARVLDRLGYRRQLVRLQVYAHHLASREDVVEWVKGTLLTDYQQRLSPDLFARFVETYRARLLPKLEASTPHFYPFKRILFWARR